MKRDLIKWLSEQIELSKKEVEEAIDEGNKNIAFAMLQRLSALVHVKVNYAELLPNEHAAQDGEPSIKN